MTLSTPTWIQAGSYNAQKDRLLIKALVQSEGVASPRAFKIVPKSPASLSVDCLLGDAFIDGDDSVNQGMYHVNNDGTMAIGPLTNPASGFKRIDTICLRVNDPNASGPAGNNASFFVAQGTPVAIAATASPLALPNTAIPLAYIAIRDTTTTITAAEITDARQLCGGLDHIGTSKMWTGPSSKIPNGWSLEDGGSLVRADYLEYFEIIGLAFTTGDDGLNFSKPDAGGRVVIGSGGSYTLAATGGSATRALSEANLPPHGHSATHDHPQGTTEWENTSHQHYGWGGTEQFIMYVGSGGDFAGAGGAALKARPSTHNQTFPEHHTHLFTVPSRTLTTGNGNGTSSAFSILQPYIVHGVITRIR